MAELTTIARPYAKAAFQFALEQNALAEWEKMLGVLALVSEDAQVRDFLESPRHSAQEKAAGLAEVCGDELNDAAKNFLQQLSANNRLVLLPAILALFHAYKAEQEKTVDVEVTSAYALEDGTTDKLVAALKARLEQDVQVTTSVDDSLIGGVVIRAGDTVIDNSIRGRLARLAEQLNS